MAWSNIFNEGQNSAKELRFRPQYQADELNEQGLEKVQLNPNKPMEKLCVYLKATYSKPN